MNRAIQKQLGILKRLDHLLEVKNDYFFKERPFLGNPEIEKAEIISLNEKDLQKKRENEMEIEVMSDALAGNPIEKKYVQKDIVFSMAD